MKSINLIYLAKVFLSSLILSSSVFAETLRGKNIFPISESILLDGEVPSEAPTLALSVAPSTSDSLSMAPSEALTVSPSEFPTFEADLPTSQPSDQPLSVPSSEPSGQPSFQPSACPSLQPSQFPSEQPTVQPSVFPSAQPSLQPSQEPSGQPTIIAPFNLPTGQPSFQPNSEPNEQPSTLPFVTSPSSQPSSQPNDFPSGQPTSNPSQQPSTAPSLPTSQPTTQPSSQPFSIPSQVPSLQPNGAPSGHPSMQPSSVPSVQPTQQPSTPTSQPSSHPTCTPSVQPTGSPSAQPVDAPSSQPSTQPSWQPTQPTSQPSSAPSKQPLNAPTSKPSFQPLSRPTGQPTVNPTSQPSAPPAPIEWFYQDVNGDGYIACYCIDAVFAFLLFMTYRMQDEQNAAEMREILSVLTYSLWAALTFIFYCARFHYLLHHNYTPYISPNGVYNWHTSLYDDVTQATLRNEGCSVTPGLYDRLAPKHSCTFIIWPFTAELVTEGEAKFSIGIGLVIFFGILCLVLWTEQQMDAMHEANPNIIPFDRGMLCDPGRLIPFLLQALKSKLLKYVVTFIIGCQQACVLMPLTTLTANPYCATFEAPTSSHNAVCYYKFAVFSIPYTIYFSLGFAVGYYIVYPWTKAMVESEIENTYVQLVVYALHLGAMGGICFCAFFAVVFCFYYLFMGFFIGLYFQFAAIEFSRRIFINQIMGVSLFAFVDVVRIGYEWLRDDNNAHHQVGQIEMMMAPQPQA